MTSHKIINGNSNNMKDIRDKSVNLIITSPLIVLLGITMRCDDEY